MMETVGVVGLGTMGLGIALVYSQAGHPVLVTDAQEPARQAAPDRLRALLEPRLARGQITEAAFRDVLARITVVAGPQAMTPADLVIEAIVERLEAKQALLRSVEQAAPHAVLATNTSSLSVGAIAAGLARPGQLLGLHFFNPAPVMRLVELISAAGTEPAALALARRLTEAAGKTVIPCPDRPGFIVNRCARPYYGEALAMAHEGRTPGEIDAAMQAAGYRLGPFALIDLVGADINLAATQGLATAMGNHPRYHVFAALAAQVASGDLGRKTGRGFVFPGSTPPAPPDAAEIGARIEAALVNEAAWLLSEGGTDQTGIDTAMKLGLNFPRGPFEILAARGPARIAALLAALEAAAPPHLKRRYLPAPMLR